MYKLRDIILEQSVNPKALILAGSPGAGKSSFIEGVKNALILNVDDYYMRNLKNMGVSLDLKNADAEERSKAASAMAAANKELDIPPKFNRILIFPSHHAHSANLVDTGTEEDRLILVGYISDIYSNTTPSQRFHKISPDQ